MVEKATFEEFFKRSRLHANAHLITGVICGSLVEEIANPLSQQVRYLDKLVDELAKGRKMERYYERPSAVLYKIEKQPLKSEPGPGSAAGNPLFLTSN